MKRKIEKGGEREEGVGQAKEGEKRMKGVKRKFEKGEKKGRKERDEVVERKF